MHILTPMPSAEEQLILEQTNRARSNPVGEFDALIADAATRTGVQSSITDAVIYFGVDLAAFRSQLAGMTAVAPLAWNSALGEAAETHTARMIEADQQSHHQQAREVSVRGRSRGFLFHGCSGDLIRNIMRMALRNHRIFWPGGDARLTAPRCTRGGRENLG